MSDKGTVYASRYGIDLQPDTTEKGTVYALHFERPFGHAQHYIGWSRFMEARLEHHRRGTGARLMAAVANAGIDFVVARTWPNQDRHFERALKNRKNARKLCPICRGEEVN